ncbi:MAG: thioredoxin domain-containing protein, partial [Gemmatimonadota bacterium]|nr:thioredoxin domain-containing protein [Gemmatimonadota bacterium]
HANNPVDWYPWCDEAFDRAREQDRLVLLSIGYSTCHWCHVMAHESFENEAIADLMNANFVNIKVDREERPDVDEVYMAATMALNGGQGGWPMTVFLTPDKKPIFAGTYFPPTDGYGRPGFPTLLTKLSGAWNEHRDAVVEDSEKIVAFLQEQWDRDGAGKIGESDLKAALDQYSAAFDPVWGGFGGAPKFPSVTGLCLLLRLSKRFGDPSAKQMVLTTLDRMAAGGIYDQVGGGFARYSTDREWLVPHFEKMLYDNALLVSAYVEAFQLTGNLRYKTVATETLDYLLREMLSDEGCFYSATDADSEGVEGKFFVWTSDELKEYLGEEAGLFQEYYGATAAGNFEGSNVLHVPHAIDDVAETFGVKVEEVEEMLSRHRAILYDVRKQRTPPSTDDKLLASWNGLAIQAFVAAARVFGDEKYLNAAVAAAAGVAEYLTDANGRVLRSYRDGKASGEGYLEDYAQIGLALLDLYELTGRRVFLSRVEEIAENIYTRFKRPKDSTFRTTTSDHENLPVDFRDGADGPTANPNASAALLLARLGFHLDRSDYKDAATAAVTAFGALAAKHARAYPATLAVMDFLVDGPVELVLAGDPSSDDFKALKAEVARCYLPNRVEAVLDVTAREESEGLPLLEGKNPVDGKAALYVCKDYACLEPVVDVVRVGELLNA